jgi:hypothetical protein
LLRNAQLSIDDEHGQYFSDQRWYFLTLNVASNGRTRSVTPGFIIIALLLLLAV